MNTATLNLFRALHVKNDVKGVSNPDLMKITLPCGFVFSPVVTASFSQKQLLDLTRDFFVHPEQMNSTFHKSWKKVKTASIQQLVIEQIMHYITTYGFEELGCYSESTVYIPVEKLKVPEINVDTFKVTIIHGYTTDELKEKVLGLLQSGIALHGDTQKDLFDIITGLKMKIDPETVKNKEMKILLYDMTGKVPGDPLEFLRYLLYKSIDSTLLIKNDATIAKIKGSSNKAVVYQLFEKYAKAHGLEKLAAHFSRFKPLFLAFRSHAGLAPVINKIRKLADKHHKPMPVDYLNNVTAMLSRGEEVKTSCLMVELKDVNVFRKIRLAYALKYRTSDPDSIQYKIRNGKAYATDFRFKHQDEADKVLKVVLKSIVTDLKKNVKGKKIFIPEYMTYALPATEKQFTGMLPSGSYVTVPKDIIFGVHWFNTNGHRIDLDLSLMTRDGKYGWDAMYRSGNGDVMFSGDLTDAPLPNGATELFYIQKQKATTALMFVNYFNYCKEVPVPFSIVVGSKVLGQVAFGRNFMLDPNTVVARANTKMELKQKLLGLVTVTSKECRFYFNESYLGDKISARGGSYVDQSRDYLVNYLKNMITLNDLLEMAGAEIVSGIEFKDGVDLSLAPEDLEKDTIINLLK